MSQRHLWIFGGLAVGSALALIYVIDKNRMVSLDRAITDFSSIDLSDAALSLFPQGNVTEGDPEDFTVVGTFGDITKQQQIRNKPKQV